MRLFISLIILLFVSATSFSQASDFVKVKKRNNRTVKTFFPGSFISCQTVYKNFINGVVQDIKNDSLFIKEYDIRAVPTQWGVARVDTLGSYVIGVHYKDLLIIDVQKRESFGFIKNGTLLMVGGIGYATLNVINGKYLKEPITGPDNLKSLGISLGVAGVGYLLNRVNKFRSENGRKYRIEYVHMGEVPGRPRPF